jgi:hypothetical protein
LEALFGRRASTLLPPLRFQPNLCTILDVVYTPVQATILEVNQLPDEQIFGNHEMSHRNMATQ